MVASSPKDVFINCPFDDAFAPSFRALVFAVTRCGFNARCAREADDGTESRIDKIYRIIEQSRFGIHDLSRTELDDINHLPRFNMPLELGIFLGCKKFGDEDQRRKQCLILDTTAYRFQMFISDIAGTDVTPHGGEPRAMVRRTRDWLATASKRTSIPTRAAVLASYDRFVDNLPILAEGMGSDVDTMVYPDYERLVIGWVKNEINVH